MTTSAQILERWKAAQEGGKARKKSVYWLRQLAANYQGGSGEQSIRGDERRYRDIVKSDYEEGAYNSIQVNTHIQVKSLTFSVPECQWEEVDDEVAEVRCAYYEDFWKRKRLDYCYRDKLWDMMTSGVGYVETATRGKEGPYQEAADSMGVWDDPAFRHPLDKRYIFREKWLPLEYALAYYPEIAQDFPGFKTGEGGEKQVCVVCYWDNETRAILHRGRLVSDPVPNPYGEMPVRGTILQHELGVAHPVGMAEMQVANNALMRRLLRHFRETTLRNVGVAVAKGPWDESDIEALKAGDEGVVLRSELSDATVEYLQGPEASPTALKLYEIARNIDPAVSGVNDFAKGQTDTQVDFATQLQYIAQQSGVQGAYTSDRFEAGIAEDCQALMRIAARFQGPIDLRVNGQVYEFGAQMPIGPMLGDDGELSIKPMQYKAPAQKLQEVAVLGNVLSSASALPPGIGPKFIEAALSAFDVEDKDAWLQAAQDAQTQMAQAQQAQAEAQAMATAQPR